MCEGDRRTEAKLEGFSLEKEDDGEEGDDQKLQVLHSSSSLHETLHDQHHKHQQ